MDFCDIGSAKIAYRYLGSGKKTLVIETCLGSCSAEWWHIAESLSNEYSVLLYDRPGYGESSMSTLERTPRNIAAELNKLLNLLRIENEMIIIGHSQGGLYAIEYAHAYPGKVKGLLLLDPATPFDNIFEEKLTVKEFKKSGVNKTNSYKAGLIITSLGLGFALKPLLKKAPPFYYYKFSNDATKYLLNALSRKNTYKTALAEYASTHNSVDTEDVTKAICKSSLQSLPIEIITHSSDFYIEELKYYGNMSEQTAKKIEHLWQDIMIKYLSLSSNAKHIIAPNSGHFIHLTDFEVLKNGLRNIC